ncbi:MAG: DEAD/DEAH box helicase [Dinoroseobacter sp.]|nr:DEAD/DEAH box helicase [Dinoroseobacter sp.]
MQDFSRLPKTLSAALSKRGYSSLTPVQAAVTDETLSGKDLLVSAQTGSGKTVGFGLAMASDLLDADGRFGPPAAPLAVVIAPTRELALQVRREFDWLFAEAGIVTASTVGGMDARTERRALERGAHIVVATPGRLRDHTARGVIDLSDLKTVVLDEADEMLDMGFAEDLEYILDQTPEGRRTLMFSATVPRGIAKLAQTYQKDDAKRLTIGSPEAQHSDITYSALTVAPSDIEKAIINILRFHDAQTAIVFANTRSMVARLTAKFSNRGFSVVSLSGELSQAERTNAMQALRDGRANVCVATDVAARGIDLPGLELVIHADLPSNSEALLHRSGRTGRAGRKGTSVLIVPGRQRSKAQRLLKTAKLEAEWGVPPSADDVLARDEARIIANPALDEPPSAEELAFAERLLKGRSPEQIAAAYLRLYQERHSAPELLETAPEPGQRKTQDRAAFGPSTWFSLSLGRKDRAEPRWLLPMLCRNAGLSKDAIGAIRVQYQETFVEIARDAVPAMKKELGDELALEQGAKLTELPGVPDFDASPKGPPPGAVAKPEKKSERSPGRKPRPEKAPRDKQRFKAEDREKRYGSEKPKDRAKTAEQAPHKPAKKFKPKRDKAAPAQDGSWDRKPKSQNAPSDKKRPRRVEDAADTSKPLGARKARHKGKGKATKPQRPHARSEKGGDARPFRRPPK